MYYYFRDNFRLTQPKGIFARFLGTGNRIFTTTVMAILRPGTIASHARLQTVEGDDERCWTTCAPKPLFTETAQ
jgi:hypothetical protein